MITSAPHFLRKPLRNWHLYRNAVHNHMTTIGSEDGQTHDRSLQERVARLETVVAELQSMIKQTHEAWIQKEPEETHSASKGPVRSQI